MKTTEKKHWVNGYQVRGGWFKTFNLEIITGKSDIGVMISWGSLRALSIKIFKLI